MLVHVYQCILCHEQKKKKDMQCFAFRHRLISVLIILCLNSKLKTSGTLKVPNFFFSNKQTNKNTTKWTTTTTKNTYFSLNKDSCQYGDLFQQTCCLSGSLCLDVFRCKCFCRWSYCVELPVEEHLFWD